jgi:hypothetical protein
MLLLLINNYYVVYSWNLYATLPIPRVEFLFGIHSNFGEDDMHAVAYACVLRERVSIINELQYIHPTQTRPLTQSIVSVGIGYLARLEF